MLFARQTLWDESRELRKLSMWQGQMVFSKTKQEFQGIQTGKLKQIDLVVATLLIIHKLILHHQNANRFFLYSPRNNCRLESSEWRLISIWTHRQIIFCCWWRDKKKVTRSSSGTFSVSNCVNLTSTSFTSSNQLSLLKKTTKQNRNYANIQPAVEMALYDVRKVTLKRCSGYSSAPWFFFIHLQTCVGAHKHQL